MGLNTLGNLIKEAALKTGLGKRVTNHSMRKTTVTTLSRAGVPPQKIMKITGHKNIQSITHYDAELSSNEHKNMSLILQHANRKPLQPLNININENISDVAVRVLHNVAAPVPHELAVPVPHDEDIAFQARQPNNASPSQRFPLKNGTPFLSGCTFNNCTINF